MSKSVTWRNTHLFRCVTDAIYEARATCLVTHGFDYIGYTKHNGDTMKVTLVPMGEGDTAVTSQAIILLLDSTQYDVQYNRHLNDGVTSTMVAQILEGVATHLNNKQ